MRLACGFLETDCACRGPIDPPPIIAILIIEGTETDDIVMIFTMVCCEGTGII